jgi:general secretion pathway protein C
VGLRVLNVAPGTLLDKLGIHNGDRVERLNGFSLASPEKALEAYAHLRTARRIVVQVRRGGKPLALDYEVH